MAGLTPEELDSIIASRPSGAAAPGNLGFERADAIRREIYQRHGIPEHRSLEEAIDRINMQAQLRSSLGNDGGERSGWASPEEREQSRAAYAAQGTTPKEVEGRLAESIHLLDPRSYEYMQRFGRDADFLKSESESEKMASSLRTPRRIVDANAIRYYDGSAQQPLARKGVYGDPLAPTSGGYQRDGGWGSAAMNALSNPETGTGSYFTWAEVPASAMLTSWSDNSGDTAGDKVASAVGWATNPAMMFGRAFFDQEAWDRARGVHAAQARHLTNQASPVADFPAGEKPSSEDIGKRISDLRRQVNSAETPFASERWHRSVGFAPPGWVTDPAEAAVRFIDPSLAIPAVSGGKALLSGGKAAAGIIAKEAAKDMVREQAFDLGLQAGFGGEPGRSGRQFALGFGTPGEDFMVRSPEEVEESKRAGRELSAQSDNERVSTAKREAYQGLTESGALGPNAQMRARVMNQSRQQ